MVLDELSLDEMKELVWIYQQIRGDPDLLLRYAGNGWSVKTAYYAITRQMRELEITLAKMEKPKGEIPQ
jgi:hypothetical protein